MLFNADARRQDNGTVFVNNTCQAEGRPINIQGTAAPANPTYGAAGVFQVQFPGQPGPDCPGPNYIVQGKRVSRRTLDKDLSELMHSRLHRRLRNSSVEQLYHPLCAQPRA